MSGKRAGNANPAAFKEWLRWYCQAFTDQVWTIHEILSVGEKAVVRYSGQSTYRGGLLGLPASSKPVRETGMLIFRIAGGKVRELWTALSDLELVFELGGKVVPGSVKDATPG
ncbi:ester cyclase [Limnochorda pilosa]|uniref:Ester cyclase n=1 Tax=Limnochorda pilosa TaxID=1555112 RepID=A0A0K2SI50_LIMPI|nr:ester cyclase [Limnochorda pilosa]BAS26760.1 hypothetical protein LIP_0903 [Limnochorda pilosa]